MDLAINNPARLDSNETSRRAEKLIPEGKMGGNACSSITASNIQVA
jgi:hypothetical protein